MMPLSLMKDVAYIRICLLVIRQQQHHLQCTPTIVQFLTFIVACTCLQILQHDFCTCAELTAMVGPVAFAPDATSAVALLLMRSR